MKTTEKLASYALETSYRSFPKEVVHQGKRCFLDLIGVILGGANQPLGKILVKMVKDFGGKPQATVLGHGFKTSVMNAALVNGSLAHALDFDDTHVGSGHPSAPLIPAVLSVAEWKGLSGKSALEAFTLGFEVETRIGMGIGRKHYERGWHSTSTIGRFGSAIAAGKLLGLSLEEMKMALGLAGTQASGLRLVFGTMSKPFHAGKSAYDGVLSAVLAQRGFTSAPDIIEGRKGYFEVLGEDDSRLEPMVQGLGKKYEVLNNTFKPYAACLLTHPTIDAVIKMRNEHGLKPEHIEGIECEVGGLCMDSAGQVEPKTGLAGKFSTYYCAALALAEGIAGEDMFTDKKVLDPKMVALRKKVKARVAPAYKPTESKVTITVKGGGNYSEYVDIPKGDPRNPPTDQELESKFRSLASSVLSKAKIDRLIRFIWNLEKLEDVRKLMRLS